MRISKKLYVSEKVTNKDEVISMLLSGIDIFDLYLIFTSKRSKNTFEIIQSKHLFTKFSKYKKWTLVGICDGKKDALNIVEKIFIDNINGNIFEIKNIF